MLVVNPGRRDGPEEGGGHPYTIPNRARPGIGGAKAAAGVIVMYLSHTVTYRATLQSLLVSC